MVSSERTWRKYLKALTNNQEPTTKNQEPRTSNRLTDQPTQLTNRLNQNKNLTALFKSL